MGITLNEDQAKLAHEVEQWYYHSSNQLFQFAGPPGSGKTFMYKYIINMLQLSEQDVAPMTYIGAPAIQLRNNGFSNAMTIHSWCFKPKKLAKLEQGGNIKYTALDIPELAMTFVKKELPSNIKLIIVDEGGSVPKYLRKVIMSYGVKVLVGGDLDQLPPVGDEAAFLRDGYVFRLTQIMRQAEGSPIVYLANRIKNNLPVNYGNYQSVLVIGDDELTDEMISKSEVILCGKNATRQMFIDKVRHDFLGYDDYPHIGEKIICRKNNWMLDIGGISLANGLDGFLDSSITPDKIELLGFKTASRIDFRPRLLPDSCFMDILIDMDFLRSSCGDKENHKILDPREAKIKKRLEKFEYAYAITTHIAQGSQYIGGIYFEEYLNSNINKALNYTGITRFRKWCVYVKAARKIF